MLKSRLLMSRKSHKSHERKEASSGGERKDVTWTKMATQLRQREGENQ
jgi:hypothetical protein